jgi:hypothetical protein
VTDIWVGWKLDMYHQPIEQMALRRINCQLLETGSKLFLQFGKIKENEIQNSTFEVISNIFIVIKFFFEKFCCRKDFLASSVLNLGFL